MPRCVNRIGRVIVPNLGRHPDLDRDGGFNSISAIATKDVFERLYPQGEKLMCELTLARITAVGVRLVATVTATLVARSAMQSTMKIVDLLPRTFNMFLGPLASLFSPGSSTTRLARRLVSSSWHGRSGWETP